MDMKQFNRILRWGILLWKRLYKKITFLLLLIMIPLLVTAYSITAEEESGIIIVALASHAEEVEPLTREIWDELQTSTVIRYIECSNVEEAMEMVKNGDVQSAWIFEANIEAKIYDFISQRTRKNAFLTIIEPENRTLLKMLREVLSGTVFPHCTDDLYLKYLRENAPELSEVPDEQLLEYYYNANFEHNLFVITDIEGNIQSEDTLEDNYLLAPVRGMLAVMVVLAAFATSMYFIRDEENGTFALVPQRAKFGVELGYQLISLINVLTVVILSLALMGDIHSWGQEFLIAAVYALCAAVFAMLVRRLCIGIRALGMITPILVVVMLVICPVFFDLGALRQPQFFLPPTYFVISIYNRQYLLYMVIYTAICMVLCWVLDRITRKVS